MQAFPPNILFIMADQLAGPALPVYGHPVVKAPHISALAANGVVFESAYCASPLCAPSRFAMLAGQRPSRIGAYDNAAELAAAVPTIAHYLRLRGYATCLVGKMHFIGPDQLHGFEERLTTDIYPADFGWTADWDDPDRRMSWYHNMLSVVQAGVCVTSNQIDYDEEVAFHAVRKLLEIARSPDRRPFFLLVSFTHPHDPYVTTQPYWDRYDHQAIDLPTIGPLPDDRLDPHSRRLRHVCAMDEYALTEERVRNARHAYYANISYVDDKVGQLVQTLRATGLAENTIVIFTADHGDMLGERGLWYKMTFFEWAARIPLIVHAPGRFSPHRVHRSVSHLDLLPTLVELAGGDARDSVLEPVDGHSLVPLLNGDESGRPDPVVGEYLGEGAVAPIVMVRQGRYKYVYSEADPDQLYDLARDPHELVNLAEQPAFDSIRRRLRDFVLARWDLNTLRAQVIASQRQRRLVGKALAIGQQTPWDFQPRWDASKQYIRNFMDLDDLERRARFPAVPPPPPDGLTTRPDGGNRTSMPAS